MRRTQISLSIEQYQKLSQLSSEKGASMAGLIRQAIDKVYMRRKKRDFKASLNKIAGLWEDRSDIGSTGDYVRDLRKGSRLKRFCNEG